MVLREFPVRPGGGDEGMRQYSYYGRRTSPRTLHTYRRIAMMTRLLDANGTPLAAGQVQSGEHPTELMLEHVHGKDRLLRFYFAQGGARSGWTSG